MNFFLSLRNLNERKDSFVIVPYMYDVMCSFFCGSKNSLYDNAHYGLIYRLYIISGQNIKLTEHFKHDICIHNSFYGESPY